MYSFRDPFNINIATIFVGKNAPLSLIFLFHGFSSYKIHTNGVISTHLMCIIMRL